MVEVLVVAVLGVAAAMMVGVRWRRSADERHSVRDYQNTLDTLRDMSDRRSQATVRSPTGSPASASPTLRPRVPRPVGGPDALRPGAAHAPEVPAAADVGSPAAGTGAAPPQRPPPSSDESPGSGLVFVDDAMGPTVQAPSNGASSRTALAASGGARLARQGTSRTPAMRLVALAACVVVVVGLATAGVLALGGTSTPGHPTRPATGSARGGHARTTTPTVPPVVLPATASTTDASYDVAASPYTVVLTASGTCWVQATNTTTGVVMWTGTMVPGDTVPLATSGALLVRLGAASGMSVTLDGKAVQLPLGFHSPFDMLFQPVAAGSGTTVGGSSAAGVPSA